MPAPRLARLAQVLAQEGVQAALLNAPITMDYMAGFAEGAHERFLALAIHQTGKVALICPALSVNQAHRVGIEDVRGWRDGEDPYALLTQLFHEWNIGQGPVAVDDEYWAKHLLEMQQTAPRVAFVPAGKLVGQVLRQKDEEELALLRHAGGIVDAVWSDAAGWLGAGLSEVEVEQRIRAAVAEKGGIPTFCSVGSGPAGAEPHHLNDGRVLVPGDVVVLDFGAEYQGYQADITRTFAVSHAGDDEQAVYQTVYRAHMAALSAARIGAIPAEVDAAARRIIDEAGFGEFFVHRTGHGIGRRVHEAPDIAAYNHDPLRAGDCFSIEPGIYLPGRFGVRLENIATAGPDGGISLNAAISPDLPVIG